MGIVLFFLERDVREGEVSFVEIRKGGRGREN